MMFRIITKITIATIVPTDILSDEEEAIASVPSS